MRQPLFLLYIINNNDINKETELSTQQIHIFTQIYELSNTNINGYI